MNWQKPRIMIEDSPLLQTFINSLSELIAKQHSNDVPNPTAIVIGEIHPKIMTTDQLLFFLLNYPQAKVRNHLKKYIKETLHFLNQNLPAGLICGPVFYPEITSTPVLPEVEYQIRNDDVESVLKLSEAVLLYNAYTDDADFLTSDSFNMLLWISRFWASILRNSKISAQWLKEKGSLEHLEKIAAETLQFTLDFMGYLKAESSWLYEDLREQNKFSEIKETTCWKKIILKEGSGKKKIFDFTSFPDIKNKLVNKVDFSDYLYNLSEQYATEMKELIIDEDTLSSIWLNIVYRCFGLTISEKKLKLIPSLPINWKFCNMAFHYRNSLLELEITSENLKVSNLSSHPVDVNISDKEIRVPRFSTQTLTI